MVEQLQQEKDLLKIRLLTANKERLEEKGGEEEKDQSGDEICKEILLKNCGIVHSSTKVDTTDGKKPNKNKGISAEP